MDTLTVDIAPSGRVSSFLMVQGERQQRGNRACAGHAGKTGFQPQVSHFLNLEGFKHVLPMISLFSHLKGKGN